MQIMHRNRFLKVAGGAIAFLFFPNVKFPEAVAGTTAIPSAAPAVTVITDHGFDFAKWRRILKRLGVEKVDVEFHPYDTQNSMDLEFIGPDGRVMLGECDYADEWMEKFPNDDWELAEYNRGDDPESYTPLEAYHELCEQMYRLPITEGVVWHGEDETGRGVIDLDKGEFEFTAFGEADVAEDFKGTIPFEDLPGWLQKLTKRLGAWEVSFDRNGWDWLHDEPFDPKEPYDVTTVNELHLLSASWRWDNEKEHPPRVYIGDHNDPDRWKHPNDNWVVDEERLVYTKIFPTRPDTPTEVERNQILDWVRLLLAEHMEHPHGANIDVQSDMKTGDVTWTLRYYLVSRVILKEV